MRCRRNIKSCAGCVTWTRGPIPKKAIAAAVALAQTRGTVSLCQRSRESVCDIIVHTKGITIDAMIWRCRRLHAPVAGIVRQFDDSIEKLRLVPDDPCRSRGRLQPVQFAPVLPGAAERAGGDGASGRPVLA